MAKRAAWVVVTLAVLSTAISAVVAAEPASPLPSIEWKAAFDDALDAAWGIAASHTAIVVVGASGVLFYDADGRERVFVPTTTAQHVVCVVGDLAFVGDGQGVAAYTADGTPVWALRIPGGCRGIAATDTGLWLLGDGAVLGCSLGGELEPALAVPFEVSAVAGCGRLVVVAGMGRVALYRDRALLWNRAAPFPVVDVAVDDWDNVWILGERSVARLFAASGSVDWERTLGGVGRAVAAAFEPGDSVLGAQAAGVAVAGYRETEAGRDYMTALFSRDGQLVWCAHYDGERGDDAANDLVALTNGDILVTGVSFCAVAHDSLDDYLTLRYAYSSSPHGGGPGVPDRQPPVADFVWDVQVPYTFDWITFESRSNDPDGQIVAYRWTFGEHHWDSGEAASHAFFRSWIYDVTLEVFDEDGLSASCTKAIAIANRPPSLHASAVVQGVAGDLIADFTWTVEREQRGTYPVGYDPEDATDVDDIYFIDQSTGASSLDVQFHAGAHDSDGVVRQIRWNFGDGSESTLASPTHSYAQAGTYSVTVSATDDAGAVTAETLLVDVGGSGSIVAWQWEIGGPGAYLGGTSSDSRNPAFGFDDNSFEAPFDVMLTVEDASGVVASCTQSIWIANVPPSGGFAVEFTGEDILPSPGDLFWVGEGSFAINGPSLPSDAGVILLQDLAADGESWLSIAEWLWDFGGDWSCWTGEACETPSDPEVLLLRGGESGGLFRGTRTITQYVWDDDGDGGDNGVSSVAYDIDVANIAPYAGFEWWHSEWDGSVTPTCTGGDARASADDGPFSVVREIESWDPGGAVFVPWGWSGQVALTLSGSGTVTVNETVPDRWTMCYWGDDLSCDGTTLSGTLDLGEGGEITIYYDLYPPSDETALPGTFSVEGAFTNTVPGEGEPEVYELSLDNDVVLCMDIDVDTDVEFHAFGDGETSTGYVDPNGDNVSFDWDFGPFGTETEQWFYLLAHFEDLEAIYDGWQWIWSATMSAELTVTDEEGAATSVDATIDLQGWCSGGLPG